MAVTFVIEAMSRANAVKMTLRLRHLQKSKAAFLKQIQGDSDVSVSGDEEGDHSRIPPETSPLVPNEYIDKFPAAPRSLFSVDTKVEMVEMAELFFPPWGKVFFFINFCLYLCGDLTVYAAAVGKSLVDVSCMTTSINSTHPDNELCWEGATITRRGAYAIFLLLFVLTLGPFAFFNVQKTKYIQMFTTLMRTLAFSVMIVLSVQRIIDPTQDHGSPPVVRPAGMPALFGACIYSFMCHHSLPALITPIKDKSKLSRLLSFDFILILTFYFILILTSIFAFPNIEQLLTLNFRPDFNTKLDLEIIDYFLMLFPVLTLSASFPIIAITLRYNLQAASVGEDGPWVVRRLVLPTIAVTVPIIVALLFTNIETIVGINGSYAGAGIQYVIPVFLLLRSRALTPEALKNEVNPHQSPFSSPIWPRALLLWAVCCVIFVSVNLADKFLNVSVF
ncbi:transmembrane protein 104 homolog isoform X2 [Bemisia tabaci]